MRAKKDLITAFERGDPAAFEEILVRHVDLLSRHWMRVAVRHGKKGSLSEKVMTILFDGLKTKFSSPAFSCWVNSTAAAVAIDFFRGIRPSQMIGQDGYHGPERRGRYPRDSGNWES